MILTLQLIEKIVTVIVLIEIVLFLYVPYNYSKLIEDNMCASQPKRVLKSILNVHRNMLFKFTLVNFVLVKFLINESINISFVLTLGFMLFAILVLNLVVYYSLKAKINDRYL